MCKQLWAVALALFIANMASERRVQAKDERTTRGGEWLLTVAPSLPKEAIDANEILLDTTYLFAEGVGPDKIELGTLRTGRYYFAEVHFVNMLDTAVLITQMDSSCGCMVAAKRAAPVAPGEKGSFLVIVKPQERAMKYGKTLTVQFDVGVRWQFLIGAELKSAFGLENRRVEFSADSESVILQLRPQYPDAEGKEIMAESVTGHLTVTDCSKTLDGWMLQCKIPDTTRRYGRQLLERIAVNDRETNQKICEVELSVESREKVICRPEVIQMNQSGDEYIGTALLFGKELNSYDWSNVLVEFTVSGMPLGTSSSVKLEFQSPSFARLSVSTNSNFAKTATFSPERLAGRILVGDGVEICKLSQVSFKEN